MLSTSLNETFLSFLPLTLLLTNKNVLTSNRTENQKDIYPELCLKETKQISHKNRIRVYFAVQYICVLYLYLMLTVGVLKTDRKQKNIFKNRIAIKPNTLTYKHLAL